MSDTTRRISKLLPEVIQTNTNKNFFAATGDQLFTPENSEYLDAYIGGKTGYSTPGDVYFQESTRSRQNYQMEATAVSTEFDTTTITRMMFYDDLLKKLEWQGANISDPNRLFEGEYYSWGVPFDIDKFVNYSNYVWLEKGPDAINLLDSIDSSTITGKTNYTYKGRYSFQSSSETIISNIPLVFTTGLRVIFSVDTKVSNRNVPFIVEGVGRSISLVRDFFTTGLAWEKPPEWDSTVWDNSTSYTSQVYVVIGRGSPNQNPWSLRNRWFHKDILAISGMKGIDTSSLRAHRPILEFDRDLELFNFGSFSRGQVNLVDTLTTSLDSVNNQSSYFVVDVDDAANGGTIELDDNMLVLFTNLTDSLANNRVYKVTNKRDNNTIVMELQPRLDDATGAPVAGDCIGKFQHVVPKSENDPNYSRAREIEWITNWRFNGVRWVRAQSIDPIIPNQAPLFNLYDVNEVGLADPTNYPGSNFSGNTIFQYKTTQYGVVDPVLNFPAVTNSLQPNDFVFENTLVTKSYSYLVLGSGNKINGMFAWRKKNTSANIDYFGNNWYTSPCLSRQYVVNESFSTLGQTQIVLDQSPSLDAPGPAAIEVKIAGKRLVLDTDYTVSDNIVTLNVPVLADQFIKARSWNQYSNKAGTNGYFEVPRNLEANPTNGSIENPKGSEIILHLQDVIDNQKIKTWRDSAQDFSLGTIILQHRAPMLKLMALSSIDQTKVLTSTDAPLDPILIMQWVQREYLRFYNKFVNNLINIFNAGGYTGAETTTAWINRALKQVNLAKTPASPWANSGPDGVQGAYCSIQSTNPSYVPTTATRLGITPAWKPVVFYDQSQTKTKPLSMRCHNGAVVVLRDGNGSDLGTILNGHNNQYSFTSDTANLSHPVARAWLQFELNMFNNMPAQYGSNNPEQVLTVDTRTIFSGKWRKTNYSLADRDALLYPIFERWSVENQVDVLKNTTASINDPFSWNYGAMLDRDGQSVPGNWRGIYQYFYDTDQPHIAPWEMLGFTQQPSWWTLQYGPAPYTRGNLVLWRDLRDGVIRSGPRKGTHHEWARPGLLDCIPVDSSGNLLPPFEAGIVANKPSWFQAKSDWAWGDGSPIEHVWKTTVDYDLVLAQLTYLAKPAQFVEYLWDTLRTEQIFPNQQNAQWISTDSLSRKSPREFLVQRENPQSVVGYTGPANTFSYYGSGGIQQWISEYVVSLNQNVSTYFGDIIRGVGVQLGHKMGGFTDSTNLRILVDSFGLSKNDSLLIPQEDATVQLYRVATVDEVFYTGVIIESMGSNNWRVIGYDVVDPKFTIIPSLTTGPKNTVVVDNVRVTQYQQGKSNTISYVPYGTIFPDVQSVYDFLIGLGRYQASQGWKFEDYSSASNSPQDWSLSAREFLFWSQGAWAPGTFIALSPLANKISYTSSFGMTGYAGGIVNGCYSLLDRGGRAISTREVDFLRLNNTLTVNTIDNTKGVYGLRLYTNSIEHAVLFNNSTIFGDTVYNPVLDVRQTRIKLLAKRTLNWNGRLEAPGYIINQTTQTVGDLTFIKNSMFPNFEKTVVDISNMYDIDYPSTYQIAGNPTLQTSKISQTVSPEVQDLARHLIGYQARSYLTNLLVDDNTQLQFYQGMIQQKGTANSINTLLRDTRILGLNENFNYYEEFAFREGEFGAVAAKQGIDIFLDQTLFTGDPQLVEILEINADWDNPNDDTITVFAGSKLIQNSTPDLSPWAIREFYGSSPTDLPTAGYVLFSEVDYTVANDSGLSSLWTTQNATSMPLVAGNVVWKFIDTNRMWDIYKIYQPLYYITGSAPGTASRTTITTSSAHGLTSGTWVIIESIYTNEATISGTFQIFNITSTTFDILYITGSNGTPSSRNALLVYSSMRFKNLSSLTGFMPPTGGWNQNDLVYVDGDNAQTPWTVLTYNGGWSTLRTEEKKVDTSLMESSFIYDSASNLRLLDLNLWDPIKGSLPNVIGTQVNYKTSFDPASYNNAGSVNATVNPQLSWGINEVGVTWWDLSTTRFIDYEVGTNIYRRQNWGKVAPGTSIDIYEWVRSLVPPASWAAAVATSNTNVTGDGTTPSGSVLGGNTGTPNYVQTNEPNSSGSTIPVYYFWVKNRTTVPKNSSRYQSTLSLSQMVLEPQNSGISWWAPINTTTALLGNVKSALSSNRSIWSINWKTKQNTGDVYRQWTLARPNDPLSSPPSYLWNKMRHSLVERDDNGNSIPDFSLNLMARTGIRSKQSMFQNPDSARKAFVTTVNSILSNSAIPPAIDSDRTGWLNFFNSSEPLPEQTLASVSIDFATTATLNAYYSTNNLGGSSGYGDTLTSMVNGALIIDTITATGEHTEDSSQLKVGSTILVKDQFVQSNNPLTRPAQNGVYTVVSIGSDSSPWKLIRDPNYSAPESIISLVATVSYGKNNAGLSFYQTNSNIKRIGVDNITIVAGNPSPIWARHVASLSELYVLNYQLQDGDFVLVDATPSTANKWTLWQWNSSSVLENDTSYNSGWTLIRQQSFNTSTCWSYIDWYASGYSANTFIKWTAQNLKERDAFSGYSNDDVVYVKNTGNGNWAMYVYSSYSITNSPFTLVGLQNGGVQLSDNLWDYKKYQMGYNGGLYAQNYQGWDWDSRLELNQIIQGMWPNSTGAQGLLKVNITNSINEYNDLFFTMINHVLAEQTSVDWLFKTSFINLRGFSQQLARLPLYQNSADITDNLVGYINETKPYRVKIREFVQNYANIDICFGKATDFDRPPYVSASGASTVARILDPNNTNDNNILTTNNSYSYWTANYQTNQSLIRTLKTKVLFDRVSCNSKNSQNDVNFYKKRTFISQKDQRLFEGGLSYAVGYVDVYVNGIKLSDNDYIATNGSSITINNDKSSSDDIIEVVSWSVDNYTNPGVYTDIPYVKTTVIATQNQKEFKDLRYIDGYTFDVYVDGRKLLPIDYNTIKNNSVTLTKGVQAGLVVELISIKPYTKIVSTLLENQKNFHDLNYTVGNIDVYVDKIRLSENEYSATDGSSVFLENEIFKGSVVEIDIRKGNLFYGAANRIAEYYSPVDDMLPIDSPDLISGCAPSVATLDGNDLNLSGKWDQFSWDSLQPWDETADGFEKFFDLVVSGGVAPNFLKYTGNGVDKRIMISIAPQNPGGMIIWVNGIKKQYKTDWKILNFIKQATVLFAGEGYAVNDVLTLPDISASVSAVIRVSKIDTVGGIVEVEIEKRGVYEPEAGLYEIPAVGGTGVGAIFGVLWGGTIVEFAHPLPASNYPNVWIMEAGNTFQPASQNALGTIYDGGTLASVASMGGHPEELMLLRSRDQLQISVKNKPLSGVTTISNQSFYSDGVTDQFPIGVHATSSSVLFVSHNGILLTGGPTNDYVLNYDTQRVVFVNAPSTGTVNIYSMRNGTPSFTTDNFNLSQAINANQFQASNTPSTLQSVIVKVNGAILNPYWDYTVLVNNDHTFVQVHPASGTIQSSDSIQVIYPTGIPEKPSIGFTLLENLSGNQTWIRNSKKYSTVLLENCLFNSQTITIQDGRAVDNPTPLSPGAILVGGERILYWTKTKINENPNDYTTILSGLVRGNNLTSGAGISNYTKSVFWSGDGKTSTFAIPNTLTITNPLSVTVIVNGKINIVNVDFTLSQNFDSLNFVTSSIPSKATNNIMLIVNSSTNISHKSGSTVINAGNTQYIEGGIPLSGAGGLQNSSSLQSQFLLNEPLTV